MREIEHLDITSLSHDSRIDDIASKLISMQIIPPKYINDTLHIGYSMVNEMTALISWNMSHMVKYKTRKAVSALCKLEGLKELDILTPEEVIEDEG